MNISNNNSNDSDEDSINKKQKVDGQGQDGLDDGHDDEQYDEQDDEQDDGQEPQYNLDDTNILDSIAIARETYLFSYGNGVQDNNIIYSPISERNILKFIYEQVANIYTDRSLIEILGYIRHYYAMVYPEYERIVDLFYLSVYPQALSTDQQTAGIIQMNINGGEVNNSYINVQQTNLINNFLNNMINPDNINNTPFDISANLQTNSSLFNEIMFLSSIFNMRSNESLLNVLNLMNNIIDTNIDEKQTATNDDIKQLTTDTFECIGSEIKDKNSEFCTICQENYEPTTKLKILPCGHFFHCGCIEPWLLNCSNLCPICRTKV